MVENILIKMDHKIIQQFSHFLDTVHFKITKLLHGSLKECQKEVLHLGTQQAGFDLEVIHNMVKARFN